MVHLKKIKFDELPLMAKIFVCAMTNLYNENLWGFQEKQILEQLVKFAKEYDEKIKKLVVELQQQDADKKLLKSVLKDAERTDNILNGGLVQISIDVLSSRPGTHCLTNFDYVIIYPKDSVLLNKEGVGKYCKQRSWHACFVGLRQDQHYICCVNKEEEGGKWFDTLPPDGAQRPGCSLKVDDLVFLVDRVTHKP
jgi:hypothetical protein